MKFNSPEALKIPINYLKGHSALFNPYLLFLCLFLGLAEGFLGLHSDFAVYYKAVQDFWNAGWFSVYDPNALTPFKYHPFALWCFFPFGMYPWSWSVWIWAFFNAFFTYDACRRFQHTFQTNQWIPALALIFLAHAWSWQIKFSNITCLMLWLFSLFSTRKQIGTQSFSAAALILLKPFWLVILPFLVVQGYWRILGQTLLWVLAGTLLIFITGFEAGLEAYQLWQTTLSHPTSAHNYLKNDNQSIYAAIYLLAENFNLHKSLFWGLLTGLYFLSSLSQGSKNMTVQSLAMLPVILFAGPLSWIHHQILLVPVFIYLLNARQYWVVGFASLCLTFSGEGFIGRENFMLLYQARIPVLGFLALSLGLIWANSALYIKS